MRRLRGLWWQAVWLARAGVTLDRMPVVGESPQSLVQVCLHQPGCWSYCTGGYRYCLCCMKVRVRC